MGSFCLSLARQESGGDAGTYGRHRRILYRPYRRSPFLAPRPYLPFACRMLTSYGHRLDWNGPSGGLALQSVIAHVNKGRPNGYESAPAVT